MIRVNPFRSWMLVPLCLAIAGCGFQLQGRAAYVSDLDAVYLQVDNPNSDLARQLTRSIEAARVGLTREPKDATAVIEVIEESYGSRVKSVSAQNRPTELEVFYSATYIVRSGEKILVPRERITRTRVFTYDERKILAKQQEEALLLDALAKEISGVITRRLADVKP